MEVLDLCIHLNLILILLIFTNFDRDIFKTYSPLPFKLSNIQADIQQK